MTRTRAEDGIVAVVGLFVNAEANVVNNLEGHTFWA